jgi:RNA polymerase sigma-70 factor (ECF subfamily)
MGAELSDTQLWLALQEGQSEALGILYDRHAGFVYAIALKTTKNTQDAEDLTHNIFLNLPQSSYNPQRGSLRTFLGILTRSRSLDLLRSRAKTEHTLSIHHLDLHPSSDRPDRQLDREESTQQVQNALSRLSEQQQQVLHLAYRDGLSQSAIAKQLNIPLGTVKTWMRRGLIQLRHNLQDRLGDR